MNMDKSVWKQMQDFIENLQVDAETKRKMLFNLTKLKSDKLNVLIVGASGSGKSTTINAVFDVDKAKVGYGPDPLTMDITVYELENLYLYDTPGLGDNPQKDIIHKQKIIDILNKRTDGIEALIDLVLVIVDGSSRDLGTTYDLINNTIIPNINDTERILVAINQCDLAMKGRGWNETDNCPDEELYKFLDEKVCSVKKRIFDGTGVQVEPIYYSALKKYNISKLLSMLVRLTPMNKRIIYTNEVNYDYDWDDDDERDYKRLMQESLDKAAESVSKDCDVKIKFTFSDRIQSAYETAKKFGEIGSSVCAATPLGKTVGKALGTGLGAIIGFVKVNK